ncbi:MAG: phosphoribosylformylglycinamidine cyclo-ligase [Clostridiales Family XIII bacterium]|jgi:phosphoribosylformylglycinamidine cyclo-ligase|nr:phosphoribosylformylglycinamidine cyclo-ligase [Clostridiales Family XIII bacterium]
MGKDEKLTYKSAGVDTKEGERAVALMKEHVKKTFDRNVLTGLGGFGSLYRLDLADMAEPVLVAGTDGVGTKLKLAFMTGRHDTIGQDCVAMCVNDVLCQGARPLFFLDYLATGRLDAEKAALVVKGVADGCLLAGCALVGGETAEMPGFYQDGEYDMAGFAVGLVDRAKIVDGSRVKEGDAVVGIASSGLHSNGFSLARKVFFEKQGYGADRYMEELGMTLGEALLTPTRIYAKACGAVFPEVEVLGMAHVTGGGFYENLPRALPAGLGMEVWRGSWPEPPIFGLLAELGGISGREMFSTFNMGVGMVMIVRSAELDRTLGLLHGAGEEAWAVGEVRAGEGVTIAEGGRA